MGGEHVELASGMEEDLEQSGAVYTQRDVTDSVRTASKSSQILCVLLARSRSHPQLHVLSGPAWLLFPEVASLSSLASLIAWLLCFSSQ